MALRGAKRIAEEKRREEAAARLKEGQAKEAQQFDQEDSGEESEEYEYDDDWGYDEDDEDEIYTYQGEFREEDYDREHKFELLTIPQEILNEYNLPKDLPGGVSIMGGTARSIARRLVTGDKEPVRDLDLVYIPELADIDNPPSKEELDQLSEKYMADDYAFGHGIGTDSLEQYFEGRDFTVNQCLVAGDKLLMTRAAYDDFQENIIRPSVHEQTYDEEDTKLRQLMRALLMQAVVAGFSSSYPTLEGFYTRKIDSGIRTSERLGYSIRTNPFEPAVTMNKAISRGAETANRFTDILVDWGIVSDEYINKPLHLARDLKEECYDFSFWPAENSLGSDPLDYDSLEDEYESLRKLQPSDPEIRKAMREYESHNKKDSNLEIMERMGGAYSQDDYDWINREGKYSQG